MSNDFLKNIRSGKDKQSPQSRTNYDRHQYHYENQQQYFGNEKRNGVDRRRGRMTPFEETLVELLKAVMPAVTAFFENAAQCQKRMIEFEESKTKAESDKTDIMRNALEYVKTAASEGTLFPRDTRKKKTRTRKPLDQNRKRILQVIEKMRNKGETFDNIALYLEKEQFQTFSGRGQWHAQTVHRLFQDYLVQE